MPDLMQQRFDELDVVLLGSVTPEGGVCLCDDEVLEALKALLMVAHIEACMEGCGDKMQLCDEAKRIDALKVTEVPNHGRLLGENWATRSSPNTPAAWKP